ncbi:MAG: hypothetical protein APR55_03140 [Methanolinea sp. SDB]|nr:MAG: hypothetical protein APR55_03140 [Methanolinea sp. SDB]
MKSHVTERYWEIDISRGIAVVMMIIFHIVFDLNYFEIAAVNVGSGFWRLFAGLTASLFLFLVGISLTLSGARAAAILTRREYILKFIRRGLFIMGLGAGITIITWLAVPEATIIFGILHLIGFSVMLAPIFLRLFWGNLLAGVVLITAGLSGLLREGPCWLLWLGVHPLGFTSLDYTPLVPWLGVVLLGIFLGKVLYPGGLRRFGMVDATFSARPLMEYLGRHSLLIYLLHQPVILLLLYPLMPA